MFRNKTKQPHRKKTKSKSLPERISRLAEKGYTPYLGTLRIRKPEYENVVHADSATQFDIFGDESVAPGVVVYSLIALNWADVHAAERDVGQVITDSGMPEGTRLHANAIFHGDKRKKTPWGELSKEQILQTLESYLKSLKANRAIFSLGVVDQSTYPKKMASGLGDKVTVTESELYPLAFYAASASLNMLGFGKEGIGLRWYIDPQTTKTRMWGPTRMQVQRMFAAVGMEPEPLGNREPLLLDASDLFAYIAARAVSSKTSFLQEVFRKWYQMCEPLRAHMWWIPNSNSPPSSFLRELADPTRIEL